VVAYHCQIAAKTIAGKANTAYSATSLLSTRTGTDLNNISADSELQVKQSLNYWTVG